MNLQHVNLQRGLFGNVNVKHSTGEVEQSNENKFPHEMLFIHLYFEKKKYLFSKNLSIEIIF